VVKRKPISPYNGFGKRKPSTAPPVLTPAERAARAAAGDPGRQPPAPGDQPARRPQPVGASERPPADGPGEGSR
jgi:cell division protease FtsH